MPPPDARHLLLVAFPAWGHTRPLCVLGGRLAAEAPDIVITILMAPNWLEKARVEIATQFPVALERIRIVTLFQSDSVRVMELAQLLSQVYPGAYEAVFRGEAITCAVTGTTFSALPPPTAIIMDFFVSVQLHQTRAISGTAVPIFAFASCGSAALIRLFAPKALGGLGDFGARTDAEARRTGESVTEVGDRIFKHTDGTVVHVAGIPPMFDYEFFPQKLPWDVPMAPIVRAGHEMFTKSDGIFIRTCAAYDGEALSALEGWLTGGLGKPLYAVGPLLPPGSSAGDAGEGDGEIRAFLDAALARYGEKSTLLISFGTIFWPTVPAHLDALVDTLIEKNFPFILCHASPFAAISTALREKIERGGLGLFTRWCPQQFVLSHPATGWFMTHGGHGGINEALSNGVPLICWPFDGDQPAAAVLLSQTLDAAFHLVQVRTGASGLRPLFCGEVPRGGAAVGAEFRSVTDACRGPEGERKRVNARKLQAAFGEAWGEGVGGTARTAVRAFVERWMRG